MKEKEVLEFTLIGQKQKTSKLKKLNIGKQIILLV